MIQRLLLAGILFAVAWPAARSEVLIVADEFPAMQVIAAKLKAGEGIESKLVWQTNLPPALGGFQAVIVYIHKDLSPKAENAFIDYAEGGGKLVVLHHSISSGKRKNARWFSFLGVELPEGDLDKGGYKWIEGITWTLVDIAPLQFIMTNKVDYPEHIAYVSAHGTNRSKTLPGFTLEKSEVYLNHIDSAPRIALMGLKYVDAKTGVTYMQDTSGWLEAKGKGVVIYLMPGHTQRDFENPAYGRIVLNAVIYKP